MPIKAKVLGNAKRGKVQPTKRLTTKPTQGQPNTMEVRFAQLEALITSMVAQVKSTAFGPRKVKDKEDDQSYGSNVDQGLFCGASVLGSVAPNEMMPHMSRDHEP